MDIKLTKRMKAAREGVERTTLYSIVDAVKMVKERAKAKFDETIDVAVNLGIDPRQADQQVRGVCALPNGRVARYALACLPAAPRLRKPRLRALM